MAPDKICHNTLFNKNLIPLKYVTETRSNLLSIEKYPQAINYWLKVPKDKLNAVIDCTFYALQGILMFDDIQDGTLYRRNLPATNRVYGDALTLNSSIFTVIEGFNKALNLGHPMAPSVYCEQFIGYMEGQGLEIYWRDNYICPTEDELLAMLEKKSGCYYSIPLRLMQLFSEDKTDYQDFINLFATYMQMRDDYCNLVKVMGVEEKSRLQEFKNLDNLLFCEDITEGRFSWPMVHALKSSEGPTIRSILVQHTRDVKIKQYCLTLLKKAGSLEFTRQTLIDMEKKLREQLKCLGGNPMFTALLDELNTWNDE